MREFLEVFRNRALDVMSSALPAESLLEDFALALQARLPGVIVGINVLDKAGRTFRQSLFPNLPSGFSQALTGNIITGKHGSCGLGILKLSTSEIDMVMLIQEMLAPYRTDCSIHFSGPDILLTQEAASALTLVVPELSTNAAKYGALSQPGGELNIEWLIVAQGVDDLDATFKLMWTERNGPLVEQPDRKGYGTAMIKGSLSNAFDGVAMFFYEPCGVKCEISAPFTGKLGKSN
ncbi:hypothetical protein [Pseudomonas syringae group genomosp. 7]|nr:hypothetical protein [Pseudomonas syringae group genomosp. 7]UNB62157.1 hypothetical protein MME54_21390 [Pseudomonas syringae pv. helianthi]